MSDNIHVVLDSVSAVTETDFIKDPRVHLLRLVIALGGEEWYDGDKTLEEMVAMIEKVGKLPKTSQPPLGDIHELFTSLAKEGKKIIMVTMSSGLSGTNQACNMVAQQVMDEIPGSDIRIIDGKTCGSPLVGIAKAILAKVDAGCEDMDELERYGKDCEFRLRTYFSVNTLDYLAKGGRVGKASAMMGSLLGIRPILIMDEDGKVEAIDKCRTRKKVLKRLIELAGSETAIEEMYVCGALCEEDMDYAQAELEKIYPGVPCIRTSIGTVLTAHLGPGVIGLFVRIKE